MKETSLNKSNLLCKIEDGKIPANPSAAPSDDWLEQEWRADSKGELPCRWKSIFLKIILRWKLTEWRADSRDELPCRWKFIM